MSSWGKKRHPTASRSGWEPIDAVPSLAPVGSVPTLSCASGDDDLLAEIDSLLNDHDVLIGFWQAGGE